MNPIVLVACATRAQEPTQPVISVVAEQTAEALDTDQKLEAILQAVAARSPDDAAAIQASGAVELATDACGCLVADPACSCPGPADPPVFDGP